MNFQTRFGSVGDIEAATVEAVGAAIVIDMQQPHIRGRIFANNYFSGLRESYGRTGQVDMAKLGAGLQWALQNFLVAEHFADINKGVYILTGEGRRFSAASLSSLRLQHILPSFLLHAKIRSDALAIFQSGKFSAAVFQAFKTVEIHARERAGYTASSHGIHLFRNAFHAKDGPLRSLEAEPAEAEAFASFAAGAYGAFRNPQGHRDLELSAEEAAELMVVASHLMRAIDRNSDV
jgi:uncharacterized protein (TIGR02391 family)